MNTRTLIYELLQANYEALPLLDRLGAADTLGRVYRFVVDNGVESDYCSQEEMMDAADRLYSALLMSYTTADTYRQRAEILLGIGSLVYGLQGVPNRRRADHLMRLSYKLVKEYLSHPMADGEEEMLRLVYLYQYSGGVSEGLIRDFLEVHPEELADYALPRHRFSLLAQRVEKAEQEIQSMVLA